MSILKTLGVAAMAAATLVVTAPSAAGAHDRDYRHDRYDHGRYEHARYDRGRHHRAHKTRVCRMEWRHHHRVRVCRVVWR